MLRKNWNSIEKQRRDVEEVTDTSTEIGQDLVVRFLWKRMKNIKCNLTE